MDFELLLGETVLRSVPISGGCIGVSHRVDTPSGSYFIKTYVRTGVAPAEAAGLEALKASKTLSIPQVLKVDDNSIVLKFVSSAPRQGDFQSRLGRGLAQLHRTHSTQFGFSCNNFIGATPQLNGFKDDWIEFYIENRLDYQVEISKDSEIEKTYRIFRRGIPDILGGTGESPSLLHGDLWSGNVMADSDGLPLVIDPAAYFGHREMELAMTRLFGGFTSDFYNSYHREYPLQNGWQKRLEFYELYHVLNHMNLFGGGYKKQSLEIMKSFT